MLFDLLSFIFFIVGICTNTANWVIASGIFVIAEYLDDIRKGDNK